MSHKPKELHRCEFVFPSGRRCRQPRASSGVYCFNHERQSQQQDEAARVGDEIVGAEGALNTEEGIHAALANVFANLARKRISARDASVLGYVGQLMLISRPSVERTFKSMYPMLQLSFKIGKQDKDADIKSSRELLKNALLEQEVIDGILAQSAAFNKMTPKDLLAILKFGSMFSDKPFTPPGAKPAQSPAAPSAAPVAEGKNNGSAAPSSSSSADAKNSGSSTPSAKKEKVPTG